MTLIRETFDRWCELNSETGCLEWQRSVGCRGYGQLNIGGKPMLAHRFAWERMNGPIPTGLHVLHRCDNRKCVNVAHLFLGTNLDNIRDKQSKGRAKGAGMCGESHPLAKLTWEQVCEIRRLYVSGGTSQYKLAAQFHVAQTCIGRIVRGLGWKQPEKTASVWKKKRVTVAQSFDDHWKLDPATGCWNWQLALSDSGHGKVSFNGGKVGAHKFSYMRTFGDVPVGLVVRHTCNNAACVNPDHLTLGTQADNVADMVRHGRQRAGKANAKIHAIDAERIRAIYASSNRSKADIGREFHLSACQIKNIVTNKCWIAAHEVAL